MTNRFTDRVAFVAGAAGALGGAVARGLAKEGAKLALFDQNAEALAVVAASCPDAVSIVGDATLASDFARAA
jgi:NADP-dependent 3-hydroxy acid dehydrogenase YdfG